MFGQDGTGCSIKYCVFSKDFRLFRTLVLLCFPSVSVCVHTHQAGRTPALDQNSQSSEKSQNFKEKIQYLMYMRAGEIIKIS